MASMPDLPRDLVETVARALAEDEGSGDVTAALIPQHRQTRAVVLCRERAVICGRPWFDAVFQTLSTEVTIDWQVEEGVMLPAGRTLCTLEGPARSLLTGERTALNFLQSLSGVATKARQYADAVKGTKTRVLDTRKTLPGLRSAQKYAVRCGGCHNHRIGLYDMVLIKENHIAAAGSIREAVATGRRQSPGLKVEVEVETLDQLREAIDAGADVALLDNFELAGIREAVAFNAGRIKLEVSGGIQLEQIAAIAATGVDYISVGALTKDVRAVDLSMRFLARR
jgi:nicotinate-nucleotide pyrophosphorylase (carboxylating)